MRRQKPDLLFMLSLLLVIGVVLTSYGPKLLDSLNVQAKAMQYSQNGSLNK